MASPDFSRFTDNDLRHLVAAHRRRRETYLRCAERLESLIQQHENMARISERLADEFADELQRRGALVYAQCS